MKRKIVFTDESITGKRVEDFLPPPEMLVMKEDNTRITITLSKNSIEHFKKWANAQHVHYQTMIRKVLDRYVTQHAKP